MSLGIYAILSFLLKFENGHSIAVFAGFFAAPVIVLLVTKQKKIFGEFKGWFWTLSAYDILLFWVLAYYFVAPEKFAFLKFENLWSAQFLLWNIFTAMNVMPVDYFSKRIVQHETEAIFGAKIALALQVAVWCAAHVPEFLWLNGIMGNIGAGVFILFSGIATGLAYWKTKNVWGMMLGHWALNMGIALVANIF
ncbi:MAG: hypothetical protein PHH26_05960 [Candidatus Thermoplasmatota archaeon]|nr:hypothetical protein [Candidatus Thermoplasmatota archaeon]